MGWRSQPKSQGEGLAKIRSSNIQPALTSPHSHDISIIFDWSQDPILGLCIALKKINIGSRCPRDGIV